MGVTSPNHAKVVLLFGGTGAVSSGATLVLVMAFHGRALLLTSLPLALLFVLAAWAIQEDGLPYPASGLIARGCAAGSLLVLTFPVGLLLSITAFFGIYVNRTSDSDNPAPPILTAWEAFRNHSAIPAALLLGGTAVLLLTAVAVRALVGGWPRRVWSWTLVVPFLVSLLTMLVALLRSAGRWDPYGTGLGPGEMLLTSGPAGVPLLVSIGQPVLGAVVGDWIWTTSTENLSRNIS